MEDYKEKIKELLLWYYTTIGGEEDKKHYSTTDILQMCRGVIPSQPITEHDVYEVLQECGFCIEQVAIMKEICTFEGDEENNIPPEYENEEAGKVFLWRMYEKK